MTPVTLTLTLPDADSAAIFLRAGTAALSSVIPAADRPDTGRTVTASPVLAPQPVLDTAAIFGGQKTPVTAGGAAVPPGPPAPPAPSSAVAAALPTAPVAPPPGLPVPPTGAVPSAPTPGASAGAPAAPAAPTNPAGGVETDKNGMPWDGRIHAGNKAKTKDGSWRAKAGVDEATRATIEQQLRAAMAAAVPPAPPAGAPAPASTAAASPAAASAPAGSPMPTPPMPAAPAAPAAPASPPPPAAPTGPETFATLMTALTPFRSSLGAETFDACTLPVLAAHKLTAVGQLVVVAASNAALFQQIAGELRMAVGAPALAVTA